MWEKTHLCKFNWFQITMNKKKYGTHHIVFCLIEIKNLIEFSGFNNMEMHTNTFWVQLTGNININKSDHTDLIWSQCVSSSYNRLLFGWIWFSVLLINIMNCLITISIFYNFVVAINTCSVNYNTVRNSVLVLLLLIFLCQILH